MVSFPPAMPIKWSLLVHEHTCTCMYTGIVVVVNTAQASDNLKTVYMYILYVCVCFIAHQNMYTCICMQC